MTPRPPRHAGHFVASSSDADEHPKAVTAADVQRGPTMSNHPSAPSGDPPARIGHAVVVGASIAGLLAARALSDHAQQVTIIERDQLPNGPAFRAGVPQSRHLHVLISRGLDLYDQLFPGFQAGILDAGAQVLGWADALWLNAAGWSQRYPQPIRLLGASRHLLEAQVRTRVADSGVEFRTGLEVVGLLASPDTTRVTGVQVRARDGSALPRARAVHPPGANPTQEIPADLVVDASGRSSRTPRWLEALGYPPVAETKIDALLGYASRYYQIPAGFQANWRMLILPPAPPSTRGGVILPIEDKQWLVTLGGYGGDHPGTDEAEFLEFAASLRHPLLHQTIRDAEPVSAIHGFAQTANQRRHFERLSRWPDGFIAVGDAVCAFNPTYGQGMTVAGVTAVALDQALSRHRQGHGSDLTGFAGWFQHQVAGHGADAWQLATGEDLRYATTRGPRPGPLGRLIYRYSDRVLATANGNPEVQRAFLRVLHLLDPPAALFHPRVLLPVLAGWHARPLTAPPRPLAADG
jgi:flavin-dependent dehydrogenase